MTSAPSQDLKTQLLSAALTHVAFDGWTEATFKAAIADSGIEAVTARALFPRGAVDLAIHFHRMGDAAMVAALAESDLTTLKFREKIALAVRLRLEGVEDKEAVRRGTTLFSLPNYAPDGAKLIWETCDLIWRTLGDKADDFNWYTKRATLSAVYGSTVLYWLGDTSPDHAQTWDFLDRRIDNVMQFEKVKAQMGSNPALSKLFAGPAWVLGKIKPPTQFNRADLPGSFSDMWRP